jgi:hypothetical protein
VIEEYSCFKNLWDLSAGPEGIKVSSHTVAQGTSRRHAPCAF